MTDLEIFAEWHKKSLGKHIITENAQVGAMIEFAKYYKKKQLRLGGVGSSVIAEPYLISEKENQIEEMKKLGLFTEGILFEQSVNGLIQVIKDLKEL